MATFTHKKYCVDKTSMEALQRLSAAEFKSTEKLPLVLVLDNIRSGLNVGSIFRTADAFALEKIVLCGITSQPPHREILKTALGSAETVAWNYFADTAEAIKILLQDGYQVFAVEQTAQSIWLHDFTPQEGGKYALVLGNEVEGVQIEALQYCNGALEIPQYGTKHSLNVAVAAGIAVWEVSGKIRLLHEG